MQRRTFISLASSVFALCPNVSAAWMLEGKTNVHAILRVLQRARRKAGVLDLTLDPKLNAMAQLQCRAMARMGYTSHFGPEDTPPPVRAVQAGFEGTVLGETLAETLNGPRNTLAAWLSQTETRTVLLDPRAHQVGLAAAADAGGRIWWDLVIAA